LRRRLLDELAFRLVGDGPVFRAIRRGELRADRSPPVADVDVEVEIDRRGGRVRIPDRLERSAEGLQLRRWRNRVATEIAIRNAAWQRAITAAESEIVELRSFIGVEVLKCRVGVATDRDPEVVGQFRREIEQVDVG